MELNGNKIKKDFRDLQTLFTQALDFKTLVYVKCPECSKSFAAKRNMKRHIKSKHRGVEANNVSRNSNETIQDENFNPDIINAVFI